MITTSPAGCRNSPYFSLELYSNWKNYSTFNTSTELELYICQYTQYLEFRDKIRYVSGYTSILSSILGVFSSILTLATLWSNKYFSSRSFLYFRFIAVLELFHMMYIFMLGMQQIKLELYTRTYYWFWFMTCVGTNLGNWYATTVDFLTIFLSIERAVACLMPKRFYLINTRSVAMTVSGGALLLSAVLYWPQCISKKVIIDPTSGVYSATTSNLGKDRFYVTFAYCVDSFWFFVSGCVTLTAVFVLVGMLRSLKLKRNLRRVEPSPANGSGNSNRPANVKSPYVPTRPPSRVQLNQSTNSNTRLNLQLCYLQITQALPAALNYIFFSIYLIFFSSINVGFLSVTSDQGYSAAQKNLRASYASSYIKICVGLTNDLAHCFHFYLYLSFSRRFRNAFKKRFQRVQTDEPNQVVNLPVSVYHLTPIGPMTALNGQATVAF